MRKMRSALVVAISLALLGGLGGVAAAQQEEGEPMSVGSEPWDLVWWRSPVSWRAVLPGRLESAFGRRAERAGV